MSKDTHIQKWVAPTLIVSKLKKMGQDNLICPNHALFRLSEDQRKIFNEQKLKKILLDKWPERVGLQYNGVYALFYRYKRHQYRRIMVDIRGKEAYVVTFYICDSKQLPKVMK